MHRLAPNVPVPNGFIRAATSDKETGCVAYVKPANARRQATLRWPSCSLRDTIQQSEMKTQSPSGSRGRAGIPHQ